MNYKEKNEFRKTQRWIRFSERFLASKGHKCEICGIIGAKQYNTHHKFKDDYQNLASHRFMCLCRECHAYCHKRQNRLDIIARNIKKFKWE